MCAREREKKKNEDTRHSRLTAFRNPRYRPRPLTTSRLSPFSLHSRMDWTDVHYRQLARLLSARSWLYTEMVVDATLLHNPDTDR